MLKEQGLELNLSKTKFTIFYKQSAVTRKYKFYHQNLETHTFIPSTKNRRGLKLPGKYVWNPKSAK